LLSLSRRRVTGFGARSPGSVPDPKLSLRVYNYARIDPASLAIAEEVAAEVFQNVGVAIIWVDCPLSQAQFAKYPACQVGMGTTDLVLKILPRYMAMKLAARDEPLGFAKLCPESEPACELNVLYHRVDELATYGYRADRILGHVIAHEVGHVLLGSGHSYVGIMHREWSRYDLQRISWACCWISPTTNLGSCGPPFCGERSRSMLSDTPGTSHCSHVPPCLRPRRKQDPIVFALMLALQVLLHFHDRNHLGFDY